MASLDYAITTENISKEYFKTKKLSDLILHPFKKNSMLALDDINIKIKKSELVCLLGLNGAGKTTLLKILCGILLPTKGKIYLEDIEIKDIQKLKEKISFVNGDARSFYWRLTAWENLEFFGALYNITAKYLKRRLEELFSLFEIADPHRRFYEYSSGFKQRFFIIRAVLHNPDILFLDDPTRNLDYISKEIFLTFITEELVEKQKKAVIITENSLDFIKPYDKLIVLHKGKIKAQGNLEEIKRTLGISDISNKEIFQILCG